MEERAKRKRNRKKPEEHERMRAATIQITPPQPPDERPAEIQQDRRKGRHRVKANRAKSYREIQRLKEDGWLVVWGLTAL